MDKRVVLGLGLAVLTAGCGSGTEDLTVAELDSLRLTVDGTRLLDSLGREVMLRGVATGCRAKVAPYFAFAFRESGLAGHASAPPFDEAAGAFLDRVVGWGHNWIRLPFSWQALEPELGSYDQAYLDRYLALIDAAAARGLRVVVDFHQDVYCEHFCGDGFPIWTLPEPLPEPPDGCEDWYMGYLTNPDINAAFDRFWADRDGIRAAFVEMWREMAGSAWAHDGVVAFEVINEPGPGTADVDSWAPTVLRDFYAQLVSAIRESAPGAPVVLDAPVMSSATAETSLELPEAEGLIFGPHYYEPTVMLLDEWTGTGDLSAPIGRWRAQADAWGVPAILGEFGVRATCTGGADYLRTYYRNLDAQRLSAAVWEYSCDELDWNQEHYSLVDADGQESPMADEIVRPYPAAVAGEILSFEYDKASCAGTLVYRAEAGGLTEIAVPGREFPGGVHASLSGGPAQWALAEAEQRLLIRAEQAGELQVCFSRTEPTP
ncbi:MAG: cellulase family glycosylhydrolase [Deltaproteobacteria bacterium]|nr:cellulase family glycosylhydrolase [Deltaproteobacteria bacterium]